MLCTLKISDSHITITFPRINKIAIPRTAPRAIKWGEHVLAEIPKDYDMQRRKQHSFRLMKNVPFTLPDIPVKCHMRNKNIYLSPVVSILLDPLSVKGKHVKNKKGKMVVLNELAKTLSEQGMIVTAIHPEHINEADTCLTGYVYTPVKMNMGSPWKPAKFPWSEVVYNQISSRKWEAMEVSQNAKRILIDKIGAGFFNTSFLDKYLSYSVLKNGAGIAKYLLDTRIYSQDDLTDMIGKYDSLYIKPIQNSLGVGIWRYSKLSDGKYVFQTKRNGKIVNYISGNLTKLVDFFQSKVDNRSYLIQQGVRFLKYDERIFDIRALAQKNAYGKWSLTGAGARVAAPKAFMTHIPNGGEIMDLKKLLRQIVADEAQQKFMYEQLEEMAARVPAALETGLGKNFGEISMDIGVNDNLQLSLIEINAKPMKFDEKEIQSKAIEKLSQYISYLCNWHEVPE